MRVCDCRIGKLDFQNVLESIDRLIKKYDRKLAIDIEDLLQGEVIMIECYGQARIIKGISFDDEKTISYLFFKPDTKEWVPSKIFITKLNTSQMRLIDGSVCNTLRQECINAKFERSDECDRNCVT